MRGKGIGALAAASVFALTGCSSGHYLAAQSTVSADTTFTYLLSTPAVSPDGSQIAWVDLTGVNKPLRVFVARSDGSRIHGLGPRWPEGDGLGPIAWTGSGIVAESNFTFFLLSRTGRVTRIGPAGDIAFSVGGSRVASGTAGCGQGRCAGPLVAIDIHSKKQWRLGRPDQWNWNPALSPNGKRVAWTSPDGILVSAVSGGTPQLLAAAVAARSGRRTAARSPTSPTMAACASCRRPVEQARQCSEALSAALVGRRTRRTSPSSQARGVRGCRS